MDKNNDSTKGYPKVEIFYQSDWHIRFTGEKGTSYDLMFVVSWLIFIFLFRLFKIESLLFAPVPLLFLILFIKNHFVKEPKLNDSNTSFNINPMCITSQNQNMFQDFSSSSSSATTPSIKKEEVFSIPSNDFFVQENASNEVELVIESTPAIQGGDYCLKGTRITVDGIIEAMREGHTIKEMARVLKKHWKFSISEEALRRAINEYDNIVQGLYC